MDPNIQRVAQAMMPAQTANGPVFGGPMGGGSPPAQGLGDAPVFHMQAQGSPSFMPSPSGPSGPAPTWTPPTFPAWPPPPSTIHQPMQTPPQPQAAPAAPSDGTFMYAGNLYATDSDGTPRLLVDGSPRQSQAPYPYSGSD